MNIQKRGSVLGPAKMPQKAYNMIERRVAIAPAISSFGAPAISIWARELAKRKATMMSKIVWKARMLTESVHCALR